MSFSRTVSTKSSTSTPIPTTPAEIVLAALHALNESAPEWHINPLPSELTVQQNGSLILHATNSTNTTTISRMTSRSVGSVPLIPFIYLIMSILIIFCTLLDSGWLALALTNSKKHLYEPLITPDTLTERRFATKLLRFYPQNGTRLTGSQAETVSRDKGCGSEDVRFCGELLRRKFGLELEVWNARDATLESRGIREDKVRRGDYAMRDVVRITEGWVKARDMWNEEEWRVVQAIYASVKAWEAGS